MRLNLGAYYRKRNITVPLTIIALIAYAVGFFLLVNRNPGNVFFELLSDKILFATLLDLIFLYFFLYLVIIHVFTGIRRQNKSSVELLLSAPVRSQDIVLGETVAMIPIYIVMLPIILIPLCIIGYELANVGIVGLLTICFSQLLLFVIALGTGAIILSLIQSSLQRLKVSKYFRLLASMLGALIYISIYSISSWLDSAHSLTQNIFVSYLPTSLSSRIIYTQILDISSSPSFIQSVFALCIWAFVIYSLGVRIAGRVYSLEKEIASGHVTIRKKDGVLYSIVRRITPAPMREMVITHFKVFFRDSQNFATSVYLMLISYFIIGFTLWNARGQDGVLIIYTIEMAIIPVFVSIFIVSMFYLSRDALWIWKKSPGGLRIFIKSKWIQTVILSFVFLPLPFVGGYIVDSSYITIPIMVSTMILLLFMNMFSASFGIFLNVMNPSMTNKGAKVTINSLISSLGEVVLLMVIVMFVFNMFFNIQDSVSFSTHIQATLVVGTLLSVMSIALYMGAQQRIDRILD